MIKLLTALGISLTLLNGPMVAYALEWKQLHEKAETMSVAQVEAALAARPSDISDLYVSGLVYLLAHKDTQAAEAFNKILALDPAVIEARWGVAEALCRQHDLKRGEAILNEVANEAPDFPLTYLTIGYIRYLECNFGDAAEMAGKVLGMGEKNIDRPDRMRAYILYAGAKGMIAHYGGPFSKIINGTVVLANLKAAKKINPDSAEVMFGLGSFYLLAPSPAGGNLQKAGEYLTKAIEIDPLMPEAYVRLGQFYKIKGDVARYDEYVSKALSLDPGNELALDIKSGRCKFIGPGGDR